MKAILLLCFCAVSVGAQTNSTTGTNVAAAKTNAVKKAVSPARESPHLTNLRNVRARIAQIEAYGKTMEQQTIHLQKRRNLESQARQSSADTDKALDALRQQWKGLRQQLDALKLQEFQLRERYGIPEEKPAPVRRKTR